MSAGRQFLIQGAIAAGVGSLIYDYLQGDDGIIWPSLRQFFRGNTMDNVKLQEPVKKILVLGLESAGKSSILHDFGSISESGDEPCNSVQTNPTQGSKVVTVTVEGVPLEIREIGGNTSMRKYWSEFYDKIDLLIFVIDSASPTERKSLAYELLRQTVTHQKLLHVPLLMIASKQDLPTAISPETLVEESQIKSLIPLRCLTYVGCSVESSARKRVQHLMLELV